MVCTCALAVTRLVTLWSFAEKLRRVDKSAPLDGLSSFVKRGRKVQVEEQKVVHFHCRELAKATMDLIFPPPPKRRDLCQMGSRLMAKTHQLSPQDPRRCKAVALGNNSIATETFLGCLWKILKFVLVEQGFLKLLMNVVSEQWPSTILPREHVAFHLCF